MTSFFGQCGKYVCINHKKLFPYQVVRTIMFLHTLTCQHYVLKYAHYPRCLQLCNFNR
jgi:hypothetical protein